jgi:hypothetical protein
MAVLLAAYMQVEAVTSAERDAGAERETCRAQRRV